MKSQVNWVTVQLLHIFCRLGMCLLIAASVTHGCNKNGLMIKYPNITCGERKGSFPPQGRDAGYSNYTVKPSEPEIISDMSPPLPSAPHTSPPISSCFIILNVVTLAQPDRRWSAAVTFCPPLQQQLRATCRARSPTNHRAAPGTRPGSRAVIRCPPFAHAASKARRADAWIVMDLQKPDQRTPGVNSCSLM